MKKINIGGIALVSMVLMVAGCSSGDRDFLVAQIDEKQVELETVNQDVLRLQELLADAESTKMIDQINGALAYLANQKESLNSEIVTLQENLSGLELADENTLGNAFQIGGTTAKSVAGVLPPPWNAAVLSLGTLLGIGGTALNGYRAKQHKTQKTEIVKSIEVAKTATPGSKSNVVDFDDDETKKKMNLVMSAKTKASVNQIRGK